MKDTETEEHGMDSGTATDAVVCQVGVHQHQLANQCSLGENFHRCIKSEVKKHNVIWE